MGKNKKGGKAGAAPAKGKAAKNSAHPLCIRCPDLETAHDPRTHSLEDCIQQNSGNSKSNNNLWSGFPKGEEETFDLNSLSPDQCQKLLDEVQAKNAQAVAGMASQFMVISNTEDYRKTAKFRKIPITKKILDHALDTAIKNKASVPEQSSGNGDGNASGSRKGKAKASETSLSEQPDPSTPDVSKLAITEKPHNAFVAEQFMKTPLSQLGHETYAAPSAAQRQDASASSHRDEAQPLDDPDPMNIPAQAASINHTAIDSVADFTPPHGTPSSNMPLRTSLATKDNKTPVLTNHFTVNIPKDTMLYEYHVNNIPPKATRAKKRTMILDMIEHDPLLWKERDHIATDCQKKIISDRPLYNDIQLITVNDYVPGTRDAPKAHKLELQYVACHQMDSLLEYVNGADMEYSDLGATDALNIVLSKAVTDGNRDTFQVGTNRFYFRAGWHDIDDGLIAVRGYFSSIKPSMGNILLNVNTVTSPFYKAQDVSKYLELPNLQNKNAAENFLAKRRVYVNFKRNDDPNEQARSVNSFSRRCKTLVSLGAKPKEQQFFENGTKKSVWKHLRSKYINDTPETCEKYFTANVGKKGGENGENGKYYMATQLKVLPGQPYNGQLSANATSKMIDYARRGPRENVDTIMGEGMTSLQLQKLTQPLITALGLTISQDMVTVPARQIPHTQVRYKVRHGVNASKGFWDVTETDQYLTSSNSFGTTSTGNAARVQYFYAGPPDSKPSFSYNTIADGLERKWHASSGHKLQPASTQRFILITSWTEKNLQQVMSSKFDLAVVIFPDDGPRNRANYTNFRIVADQLQGVFSICINDKKLAASIRTANKRKARGTPPDPVPRDYMRNFAMKINLRCGNTNHSIEPKHLAVIGGNQDICDTMILGADVTHPGAASVPHAPSIAAVIGSVDNFFSQCPGSMRLNPARQGWIEDMKTMTLEGLRLWYTKNGNRLPKRILYYRNGVGDSYLDKILNNEVRAIEHAWDTLRQEKLPSSNQKVQITALVVTKRHHTRLYPVKPPKPTGKDLNCPPGTVVDSGITHPYYFDFYLQSHHIPKGTAKPSHYMVIRNDMDLSVEQIQDLTYHLCYTYGRSTTAVSYAPHAYYADRLCERGRLYLKPFFEKSDNLKAMLKKDEYADKAKAEAAVRKEAEKAFYKNQVDPHKDFKNPWHPNLDGKMFWM